MLEDAQMVPPVTEAVIVQSETLTVDDPAFRSKVEEVTAGLIALGPEVVAGGVNYYITNDERVVSADRKTTIISLQMTGLIADATQNAEEVIHVVEEAGRQGEFNVLVAGDATIAFESSEFSASDLERGERFGIPIALIILLVLFGAVVAALIPIAVAIVSIAITLAIVAVIGNVFGELVFFVLLWVTMIGLAVGIDYSLLIVSRFREEMERGLGKAEATERAGSTAGRTVLFSGVTVIIAICGMLIVPFPFFQSLAIGAILVVVERHGEVVRVPAEAGVVEVDHVQAFAVDDDVRGVQVGVNQAEDAGVVRVVAQHRMNPLAQYVKPPALIAVKVRRLPEAAPKRPLAHQAVGVEGVSSEVGRGRPAGRLLVQRRHDAAKPRERAPHIRFTTAADPRCHRVAIHPLEEAGVAPLVANVDRHVTAPVRSLNHDRDVDPGIEQRRGPGLFGEQFRVIVVPGPMQTQHVRPSVGIRDAKGDVLGDRDALHVGDGERPGLERSTGRAQVLSGVQGRQGFPRMRPGMQRRHRPRTREAAGS